MYKSFLYLFLAALILTTSCDAQEKSLSNTKPLNVILLIGDGMGLAELSASFYFNDQPSNFDRFKQIGLINTSSATDKITDSGAAGSAFGIGVKTYNGAMGVDMDTNNVKNIVEILSERNFFTGVVSTSSVTHATPASFYAHVPKRKQEEEIAFQLIHSDIDFFAGGGSNFFNKRKDGVDLIKLAIEKGFEIEQESLKNKVFDINKKYGYLLSPNGMPTMLEERGEFLPNATQMALDYLSQSEDGFFLMVEGSQIDWAGHDNDAEYLIEEVLDFDKAMGIAMDFAEKNGNTLVIVTADHETGGFTLGSGDSYNDIKPTFGTGGHSATLIPLFAYGPGEEYFDGIYQNTDVFHKILLALNSEKNTGTDNREF